MKQRVNAIHENAFMSEPDFAISIKLLESIFDDMFFNTDNELSHLKGYEYIYTLLDYGPWSDGPDLFEFVRKKCLKRMQKKQCFFIFDASNEGFSPFDYFSIFDYLLHSCKKHNVDPGMIIYLTSNFEDEKNIRNFAERNNCTPFHVVSFPAFEIPISESPEALDPITKNFRDPNDLYNVAKRNCQELFNGKLFSSLSRVNRIHRTIATFLLCQRKISKQALISHGHLNSDELSNLKNWARMSGYSDFAVTSWTGNLPLVVDYSDFETNWAVEVEWGHINDSTIFQIVNETLVEDFNNTSLFYSEKTFKPILRCQPFLIYGQRGCNHRLKELGYKLYDDWFDLSFDWEEDDILRYQKLLASVEKACNHLNSLSREEQIEWRFKHKEVLIHNARVLKNSAYSKNKLYQFFKNLKP